VAQPPDWPWRVRVHDLTRTLDLLSDILREDLADQDRLDALRVPGFGAAELRRRTRTLALASVTAASATLAGCRTDAELAVYVRDAQPAQLLAHYLDVSERQLRSALDVPPLAARENWRLGLTGAVEDIARARAVLLRCPEAADLALLVDAITVARLAPAAEIAASLYRGQKRGAERQKTKARRHPKHYRTIRALAATLDPHLSTTAKANIVLQKMPKLRLSPRTIRYIISTAEHDPIDPQK
jgi:hypothetical protein